MHSRAKAEDSRGWGHPRPDVWELDGEGGRTAKDSELEAEPKLTNPLFPGERLALPPRTPSRLSSVTTLSRFPSPLRAGPPEGGGLAPRAAPTGQNVPPCCLEKQSL